MSDVQSHELAEGIDKSQDVAGALDETSQETLVKEISYDLVYAENLIESIYMEIFASSEDPLSELLA